MKTEITLDTMFTVSSPAYLISRRDSNRQFDDHMYTNFRCMAKVDTGTH